MTPMTSTRQQRDATPRARRGNRAFIVEVLVLFAFLVAAFAIVMQLLVGSASHAQESLELERAVTLASNAAERFSANPLSRELDGSEDGLDLRCQVVPQHMAAGTLYSAIITVSSAGEDIYALETARYVSEVG